jgi:hypothetical protein
MNGEGCGWYQPPIKTRLCDRSRTIQQAKTCHLTIRHACSPFNSYFIDLSPTNAVPKDDLMPFQIDRELKFMARQARTEVSNFIIKYCGYIQLKVVSHFIIALIDRVPIKDACIARQYVVWALMLTLFHA